MNQQITDLLKANQEDREQRELNATNDEDTEKEETEERWMDSNEQEYLNSPAQN